MLKRIAVPDLISLSSLFLGFWALQLISSDRILTACWLVVIAAILDGLDGAMARLFHRSSRYGVEIDSLVDVVSFGVAPSFLIYQGVLKPFGMAGVVLSFLPLLAGVIRLARYNILAKTLKPTRRYFIGLPITLSALFFSSFFIYLTHTTGHPADFRIWTAMIFAVSLLMVSPIHYRRFPVVQLTGTKHPWLSITILLAGTLAVIIDPPSALFPLMLFYTILGPINWVIDLLQKDNRRESEGDIADDQLLQTKGETNKSTRRENR